MSKGPHAGRRGVLCCPKALQAARKESGLLRLELLRSQNALLRERGQFREFVGDGHWRRRLAGWLRVVSRGERPFDGGTEVREGAHLRLGEDHGVFVAAGVTGLGAETGTGAGG